MNRPIIVLALVFMIVSSTFTAIVQSSPPANLEMTFAHAAKETLRVDNIPASHGTHYIRLKAATFDTSQGEPELSSHLKIDSYSDDVEGYYLVQLTSVKPVFNKQIKNLGATVYGYIPDDAFIVKMSEAVKTKVQELEFVRWIGIYQPAYKVHPILLTLDNENDVTVTILTFGDIPLTEIVSKINALGGKILVDTDTSIGGLIRAQIKVARIPDVALIYGVKWIEPWAPPVLFNETVRWVVQSGLETHTPVHDNGIHGENVIITVADTGLSVDAENRPNHEMFSHPNMPVGPTHRKVENYYVPQGSAGVLGDYGPVGHGTHVAGTAVGDAGAWYAYDNSPGPNGKHDGHAFGSRLIMQDIMDNGGNLVPPPNYQNMFQPAYDAGSRIHTNSWGTIYWSPFPPPPPPFSDYTAESQMIDDFMWHHKDFQILFAMGNNGNWNNTPHDISLTFEAQAKNVISVGSTLDEGNASWVSDFSSRGYASDGRIKPTIVAPGEGPQPFTGIWSADYDGDNLYDNSYVHPILGVRPMRGTSMATPAVAGAVAMIRQYYVEGWYPSGEKTEDDGFIPSSALLRATLINGASEINGNDAYLWGAEYPNRDQGWGRVNLSNSLFFDGDAKRMVVVDNAVGLATGESWICKIWVEDNNQPLEFTLTWTDHPQQPMVYPSLVNDLDLRVTDPNGNTYLGNVFTSHNPGYSVPGGTYDSINVEETVLLLPEHNHFPKGTYTVEVIADNVRQGEVGTNAQPFAFVATGGLFGLEFQETTFTGTEKIVSGDVKPWTADYIHISPSTDEPLRINFDGNNNSSFMVKAVLERNGSVYGMNDLDLNAAQDDNYWIYQANYYDNIGLLIAREGSSGNGQYTVTLSPEYGYLAPPFKFSDVIDDGNSLWVNPYHVELRISTNPSLDQPEGEGAPTPENSDNSGLASPDENSQPSAQAALQENWVEVGRGRDYFRYRNELTGEYKQVIYSGPIHTWDGSKWVSYVFENYGGYYQVQHPIASARFYPDHTEFWDENFSKRVAASEDWSVERLENGSWWGMNFTGETISYEVVSEDELKVVRTANSSSGTLTTTYTFKRGSPLKIVPEFTASEAMRVRFVWRLGVEGAAGHRIAKARLHDLNPVRYRGRAGGDEERNVGVSFLDDSAKPLVNFSWYEEAGDKNLLIEVETSGESSFIHFGNFDLGAGGSAVLDPTVIINPSLDGFIDYYWLTGASYSDTSMSRAWAGEMFGYELHWRRAYFRFNISDLHGMSINSATLNIYCENISYTGDNGEGTCLLHHIYDIGSNLSYSDDWDKGIKRNFGVFVRYNDPLGWKTENVKDSVVDEVEAESTHISFRLKGSAEDNDTLATNWRFSTMEADENVRPYLEVTYKAPTTLTVSPSSFQVRSGEDNTFTATLTSGGGPLSGKRISWSDNAGGTFNPSSGTTDSSGQVQTTYTAPNVNYSSIAAKVTATFIGDAQYSSSSGSSSGTILPPNVKNGWVFWRFNNSDIDNVPGKYDGWSAMVGQEGVTGTWSFEIPRFNRERIGSTIYWRVKARASDGRENWSSVYMGGRLMNPPDPVEVSISPNHQSGTPRMTLAYVVTVLNNDIDPDNFSLEASDGAGWSLSISPDSLVIPPGENRGATLNITIPENAAIGAEDVITVTARSTENAAISASASCIAHRAEHVFKLENLYVISLSVDTYLENGSRLVVKFYNYAGVFENERVFENLTPPAHVVKSDNVPHPENKAVENATLVLTDDANNVISTITSFTVRRSDLMKRISEIKGEWPYADAAERSALMKEISGIKGQWPYAPTNSSAGTSTGTELEGSFESTNLNAGTSTGTEPDGPAVIYHPGGNAIEVESGQTFVLRHRLHWGEPDPGFYAIGIYWDSPENNPAENFTFLYTSAYFDADGDNSPDPGVAMIENRVRFEEGPSPDNSTRTRYGVVVYSLEDTRDGTFNVDIWLRAAGWGANHSPTENHPIYYSGTIDVWEATTLSVSASPITIRVPARGVDISISPSYQSGLPGATLNYAVTVTNTGEVIDNYNLSVSDNLGWGPSLSENLLENVLPGENREVTLSVTIPDNALDATDNITVTATSAANPLVGASDNCAARAIEVQTAIFHPSADVYAQGDTQGEFWQPQLKFDISSVPPGATIESVKLWLYRTDGWGTGESMLVYRVDDQTWDETITPSEFDAQALTHSTTRAIGWDSGGWDYVDVKNQFLPDYNAGNAYATIRLKHAYDDSTASNYIYDTTELRLGSDPAQSYRVFRSRDYDGYNPYLEVTYYLD
jgi:hypothetical protein